MEKTLSCPPSCPGCWLGLAQTRVTSPPSGNSPEELTKMQVPGSLPQTSLISIFGIQAQEYVHVLP